MSKTFCLLNHELTENQKKELITDFHTSKIIYPSEEISTLWSQIPAKQTVDRTIIKKITEIYVILSEIIN